MRFCPNCGAKIPASNKFCTACGYQLEPLQSAPATPTPVTTQLKPTKTTHSKKIPIVIAAVSALVLLILVFVFVRPGATPKGFSQSGDVLKTVAKNSDLMDNELWQAYNSNNYEADAEEFNITLLRNKKTDNYVFKFKNRNVYLLRIGPKTEGSPDELAFEVKPDNSTSNWATKLSGPETIDMAPYVKDDTIWSYPQYDENYSTDPQLTYQE